MIPEAEILGPLDRVPFEGAHFRAGVKWSHIAGHLILGLMMSILGLAGILGAIGWFRGDNGLFPILLLVGFCYPAWEFLRRTYRLLRHRSDALWMDASGLVDPRGRRVRWRDVDGFHIQLDCATRPPRSPLLVLRLSPASLPRGAWSGQGSSSFARLFRVPLQGLRRPHQEILGAVEHFHAKHGPGFVAPRELPLKGVAQSELSRRQLELMAARLRASKNFDFGEYERLSAELELLEAPLAAAKAADGAPPAKPMRPLVSVGILALLMAFALALQWLKQS